MSVTQENSEDKMVSHSPSKNRRSAIQLWGILMLLIGGLIVPLSAQTQDLPYEIQEAKTEIAKLKKELTKIDVEVSRTDSLKKEEKVKAEQSAQVRKRDLERRQEEIISLKEKAASQQKQIDAERMKAASRQNSVEEAKANDKRLLQLLLSQCKALDTLVVQSLPWNNDERLDRIRALRQELESGNIGLSEAFSRLNSLYKDEIRFGDEVAVFNQPITRKDGEVVNAHVLKIGNQWLVYVDEEFKKYGALQRLRKNGETVYQWQEELSFTDKAMIRHALDVKGGKKPPQLVNLPLSLALEQNSSEGK